MSGDGAAIGAAAAAIAGALTTVGAAIKGLADIKSAKDGVKRIEGDDGTGGVLGTLKKKIDDLAKRVEEVASYFDPTIRGDLDSLIEKVARYRADQRAARGAPLAQTGNFPSTDMITTILSRLDDLDRRVRAVEDRAGKNENKLEKIEEAFTNARIAIEIINGEIRHLLGRSK